MFSVYSTVLGNAVRVLEGVRKSYIWNMMYLKTYILDCMQTEIIYLEYDAFKNLYSRLYAI